MAYDVEKDWITVAGLRAVAIVIRRGNTRSHRCGYVGVPVGHPAHGLDYGQPTDRIPPQNDTTLGKKGLILALTAWVNAFPDETVRRSMDTAIDVHGGITYAGGRDYPVKGPEWWFGFDCLHYRDGEIDPDPDHPDFVRVGEVRGLAYVVAECESMATQIVALFPT